MTNTFQGISLDQFREIRTDLPAFRSFAFNTSDRSIGAQSSPELKAVSDLNRDGIDDVILHYYESATAPTILLGTPSGQFQQLAYDTTDAARRHIRNAEVVDLDNDGWLDFVGYTTGDPSAYWIGEVGTDYGVTIPQGERDLILYNEQGLDFRAEAPPSIEEHPWHHGGSTGDLDGDGLVDLFPLAENVGKPSYPLINQGSRVLSIAPTPLPDVITQSQTSNMDTGDLNGDGWLDLVVMTSNSSDADTSDTNAPMLQDTLQVIYGDGDTDFSDNTTVSLGTHWISFAEASAWIKRFNANDGTGNDFYGGIGVAVPGLSTVEVVDVNGDGRLDIIQAQHIAGTGLWATSGFKYYENTITGFVDATDRVFPNQTTNRLLGSSNDDLTPYVHGFQMGDLNADGRDDLIVRIDGGTPLNMNLRDQGGTAAVPWLFIQTAEGTFLPPEIRNFPFPSEPADDFMLGDFNGDGSTDFAAILLEGSNMEPTLYTYLNQRSPTPLPTPPVTPSDQTEAMLVAAFGHASDPAFQAAGEALYAQGLSHQDVAGLVVEGQFIEALVGESHADWLRHIHLNVFQVPAEPVFEATFSELMESSEYDIKVDLLTAAAGFLT